MIRRLLWFVLAILFRPVSILAQDEILLNGLNKIGRSNTHSAHFAQIYLGATGEIIRFAEQEPDSTKQFFLKFARSFGNIFIDAHEHFLNKEPQNFPWQRYYSLQNLHTLQYAFIGMNAHINGDMWQALVNAHPYDSIRKYHRSMKMLKPAFEIFFDSIYNSTYEIPKLRTYHRLTFGLDRHFAKKMIDHWRRRQLYLAELYYTDNKKFIKKRERLNRKMIRKDRQVIRLF